MVNKFLQGFLKKACSDFKKYGLNWSLALIDFMAWIGWATELKTVFDEMIRKRILRTGKKRKDESYEDEYGTENLVWGWDDPKMDETKTTFKGKR